MRELTGRTAVITGGASGIGLAMARAFGERGMRLVLADVQADALERAAEELRASGVEAIAVATDVTEYDAVQALAVASAEHFGAVHVLVNNAGVSITGPIWELTLDDWRWVHDVNVWGVIHGIKAFVPALIAHGEPAHVINTASLAAFSGTGDHSPYCSSKAAVLSISQSLYSELRAWDTRVGVSVVCPGMVDTRIHESWRNRPEGDVPWSDREWNDEQHQAGSHAFQGSGVPPEEIARLTLEALTEDRFYVFNGPTWPDFMRRQAEVLAVAANPPVVTWGRDLRPAASRGA